METILVVDDSHEIANFLAGTLLPNLGYEALVAYRGDQALDLIRRHYKFIHLMLLDLHLPDFSGLDLLITLGQENHPVPTILMTAEGSEQIAIEAFRLGVHDYLNKPIEEGQLGASIQRALTNSRLVEETRQLTLQLKDQVRWLTLLGQVGKSLTSTLDVDVVLKRIVDAGVVLTRADEGFLALIDPPSNQLYLRAVKNIDENMVKTLRLPANDSLAGGVLRSGKPLRSSQADGPSLKVSTGFLVYSLLHVPLISKGIPLGVLSVDNRTTHRSFSATDETMLLSLADYASASLENANLYQRARDELEERQRIEAQLRHENLHDRLTGLYNRSSLLERLKLALDRVQRHPENQFALLFLDLDRFKDVNDSLGHMVGDQLLIAAGKLLTSIMRPMDMVARLGGDEFVLLLDDLRDLRDAVRVADRIQSELAARELIPNHNLSVSASIGIVQGSAAYHNPEDILRDADIAMYRAKSNGRACYEIFDAQMRENIVQRLALETELRQAFTNNQFAIYYQPILSTTSNSLVGFEALLRWAHPTLGLILPQEFIRLAEETGLIIPLDRWVLREACRQLKEWQRLIPNLPPIKMSVNLSGKQVGRSDLINFVIKTVEETGIAPEVLNLEITESAVMQNHAQAVQILEALQNYGIHIQIDDFGVGYSSLNYLSRFPLDAVKIDRSFVSNMEIDGSNLRIVQAIVMMTRGLGIKVVAEGVETNDQYTQLRDLGCESVQGFLIAAPLDSSETGALLRSVYTDKNQAPWAAKT